MISRRAFLGTMIGGIAAGAAVRTWPFRVYSFPSEVTNVVPALLEYQQPFSKFEYTVGQRVIVKAAVGRPMITVIGRIQTFAGPWYLGPFKNTGFLECELERTD